MVLAWPRLLIPNAQKHAQRIVFLEIGTVGMPLEKRGKTTKWQIFIVVGSFNVSMLDQTQLYFINISINITIINNCYHYFSGIRYEFSMGCVQGNRNCKGRYCGGTFPPENISPLRTSNFKGCLQYAMNQNSFAFSYRSSLAIKNNKYKGCQLCNETQFWNAVTSEYLLTGWGVYAKGRYAYTHTHVYIIKYLLILS